MENNRKERLTKIGILANIDVFSSDDQMSSIPNIIDVYNLLAVRVRRAKSNVAC
jgi:hypothetical protein